MDDDVEACEGALFGFSMASLGSMVAVGAPGSHGGAGSVHVYATEGESLYLGQSNV